MYETASISDIESGKLTGVSFNRPTNNPKLKELIFAILSIEGTCFFDQDIDYLQYRNLNIEDLPADLREHAPKGAEKVESPEEVWPLEE